MKVKSSMDKNHQGCHWILTQQTPLNFLLLKQILDETEVFLQNSYNLLYKYKECVLFICMCK